MARKGEPEEEQHKLKHEARQQEAEELGENTFDCSAPSLRREQEAHSNVRVMEVGVAAEAEVADGDGAEADARNGSSVKGLAEEAGEHSSDIQAGDRHWAAVDCNGVERVGSGPTGTMSSISRLALQAPEPVGVDYHTRTLAEGIRHSRSCH